MKTPLVSIIIPTYNRCHLIGETLDSILAQTYHNWECIVIDDGSTDETEKLLGFYCEQDIRIQFHSRPLNLPKGANSCRNYGFDLSKGDFVNWFDSDDIMYKQKLLLQVKILEKHQFNFCVCQTMIFENQIKNQIGLRHKKIQSSDALNDFISNKIKWLTQAPLIRKGFLLDNNIRFNEELFQSQEWEYFVRILSIDSKYKSLNEPLVLLRKHPNSISYSKFSEKHYMSFYKARYNALMEFRDQLNQDALSSIKKDLISSYLTLLKNKNFKSARLVKTELSNLDFDFTRLFRFVQLNSAYLSFKLFNKGEKILKINF